jgi:pimeloyl-ACP methyl ester carboxylesterase
MRETVALATSLRRGAAAAYSAPVRLPPDPEGPVSIETPAGFVHDRRQVGAQSVVAALSTDGVVMHSVTGGQGPVLLLLHGWPQTWWAWHAVLPALAERFTVIAVDLPGLGDSSKPPTGYDTNSVAQWIHALISDLGYDEIYVAGHDWGGAVAYSYAAQFRSTVKRLAVIEMLVPGFGWEQLLTPSANGWVWHMAFHAVPDVPEMLTAGKEREYMSLFLRTMGAYDTTAVTESDIDEYVRCYTAPGAWHAAFQYYRAWFDDVAQNEIHAVTPLEMPVLAIGGSFSSGTFPEQSLNAVAKDVTGRIIDRCGHWIASEQPGPLADELIAFFTS